MSAPADLAAVPDPAPADRDVDVLMTESLLAAGWSAVATPSGAVFLLDPDLLATLRNGRPS